MKNLIALLVMVLMASPLMADEITITASDSGGGVLSVFYTVVSGAPVGISLNFACSDGATTTAAGVTNVDPLFPVYLDQAHDTGATYNFDPVQGSPLANADSAGVPAGAVSTFAICMGRLGQAAPAIGTPIKLCDIQLTQGTAATTCVTIAADTLRGGVVGSVFTVNPPAACVEVTFEEPGCACPGDLDLNGTINTTDFNVLVTLLKNAAGSGYSIPKGAAAYNDCGDLDNNEIVNTTDFNILVTMLKNAAGSGYSIPCP